MGLGLWDMIAIVVIASVGGGVLIEYFKTKRKRPVDDEATAATSEKLDKLERRVNTLERILTDSKTNLKDEIERL